MGRYLGPKVKLSRRVGVPIADIPSFNVKAGQTITFKEGIHKVLRDNMEQSAGHNVPGWLEFNPAQLTARINALPTPEDVPFEVNMNLIIEFYR